MRWWIKIIKTNYTRSLLKFFTSGFCSAHPVRTWKCKISCRIHISLKQKQSLGKQANIFSKKTATEVETVEINSCPRPTSSGAALLLSSPSLNTTTLLQLCKILHLPFQSELDSVGSTVRYAVGNWWYWVSRGHLCRYKVEIRSGVTDALLTHSLTHFESER